MIPTGPFASEKLFLRSMIRSFPYLPPSRIAER